SGRAKPVAAINVCAAAATARKVLRRHDRHGSVSARLTRKCRLLEHLSAGVQVTGNGTSCAQIGEEGSDGLAFVHRLGAARMKTTARRRVERAADLTLDDRARAARLDLRVGNGDGRQQ